MTSHFSRNLEWIQSREAENWSKNTVSNVLLPLFRRMNDFSLSCQLKVQASKTRITKVEVVIFVPFFYFLICLQVWLRRRSGEVPLCCALPFFTWDWSQPALRSILTHSSCFVSWKFLILLMQTEIAVLCSPSNSWKWSRSRPAFCFFFFFFSSPRSWRKRPEKSIKSMNGLPSKTRAFKAETEGWGNVFGGGSRNWMK